MLVAGVDVGAATAKTAVVEDGVLLSYAVMPTGDFVGQAARDVTVTALQKCGYTLDDLDYVCSTGYARRVVEFSDKAISEIICHANRDRIAFTGGVAKNVGVIHFMEELLGTEIVVPEPPQVMGALGAALLASTSVGRQLTSDDQTDRPNQTHMVGECSGEID